MTAAPRRAARRGFTLVEVLVALLAHGDPGVAVLAGAGRHPARPRRHAATRSTARTRLATVLTQWEQDLQAVHDTGVVPALAFDGQTLRLTRRVEAGVALVAWSVRSGVWQRWAGPATTRSGELQQSWLRSFQLLGNEPGHLRWPKAPASWQVYFHRGGAWTNAQSSGDLAAGVARRPRRASGADARQRAARPRPRAREALPDAVRLVITLDGRTLTRDIALGPHRVMKRCRAPATSARRCCWR